MARRLWFWLWFWFWFWLWFWLWLMTLRAYISHNSHNR